MGILKEGRKLQLLAELHEARVGSEVIAIPAHLLLQAAVHKSDLLRIDALELACVSPKITHLPGAVP